MNSSLKCIPVLGLLSIISAGYTFAADLPKEGSYDYTTCFTRNSVRIEYSGTHFAYTHEDTGTSVSNPSGGLFDNESVRCVGMTASFNGKNLGNTVCIGIAENADKRLTRFWYDIDGKYQREAVSGTGQYEGMVTTGSVKRVGQTEQIKPGITKYCNQGTGTYQLK